MFFLKYIVKFIIDITLCLLGIVLIFVPYLACLLLNIFFAKSRTEKPKLLWGTTAIKALTDMSSSLKQNGYKSTVVTYDVYAINEDQDFDVVLKSKFDNVILARIENQIKAFLFFIRAIFGYDVFHFYFDGGILKNTLLRNVEFAFLKSLGKKIILCPYGGDSFVFDNINNLSLRHALMMEYSNYGNVATVIQKRIRSFTSQADIVVGCLVHNMCLPRWDILPLTCYPVDTESIHPVYPRVSSDSVIKIAHATNHRGIKGTEFIIAAIEKLKNNGYQVELDVIENVNNKESIARIANADIYVDQLNMGYALAALEAMALGKVVISGISGEDYNVFKQYSYLNECHIVPASSLDIYEVLERVIINRASWKEIGLKNRIFVERRHSFSACGRMFETIYEKIWHKKKNVDLINYFHPLYENKKERMF
jgi:glycosyltransferase involved in cell wall biosynthesis